jgi:hypothetical protein
MNPNTPPLVGMLYLDDIEPIQAYSWEGVKQNSAVV